MQKRMSELMGVSWLEYTVYKLVVTDAQSSSLWPDFLDIVANGLAVVSSVPNCARICFFSPLRLTNHMVEKSEGSKTTS